MDQRPLHRLTSLIIYRTNCPSSGMRFPVVEWRPFVEVNYYQAVRVQIDEAAYQQLLATIAPLASRGAHPRPRRSNPCPQIREPFAEPEEILQTLPRPR